MPSASIQNQKVGVIGAGVMGRGLTQDLAEHGYWVVLVDTSREALALAKEEIARQMRLQGLLPARRHLAAGREAAIERITFTTDYEGLRDTGFVIENVTERWMQKKAVYVLLEKCCAKQTVLAANTSVISITQIAAATRRPDRVIGLHFMNPVPLKRMVEVIRGYHTSDDTLQRARDLLSSLDKTGVVVRDSPGFVSNRVLMLTINEAICLVQEGVAPAEDIDRLFKGCFGHPMGPLETADLIGLDTVLLSLEGLSGQIGDTKYKPCTYLRQMVNAGLLGRKCGRGFYMYGAETGHGWGGGTCTPTQDDKAPHCGQNDASCSEEDK